MKGIDWTALATEDELAQAVLEALQSVGLSGGVFSFTPVGRLPSGVPGLLKRAIPLNIDPAVVQGWFAYQNDFVGLTRVSLSQSHDPVRREMINRILPRHFVLEELLKGKNRPRTTVSISWIKALIQSGVRESYSIPIFTGRGEYWSLAAMRYYDNPNTEVLDHATLGQLYWLTANIASFCANRLEWRINAPEDAKRPLTPREIDCLYWAAKGKTAIETAELLSLKDETVRKYTKTAIAKLSAANKTHAVCIAHQLGYLALV